MGTHESHSQEKRIVLVLLNQLNRFGGRFSIGVHQIVAVGSTIINQTGQSLPVVTIWMAFFLTVSLSLSAIVNYYNRKMQLVER